MNDDGRCLTINAAVATGRSIYYTRPTTWSYFETKTMLGNGNWRNLLFIDHVL